jgi:hypothetical protein
MEVKVLKLLSGKYSKVRVFQMTQQGAGLAPWMLLAPDSELEINPDAIVASISAASDVEKQYLQATSGIQLMS